MNERTAEILQKRPCHSDALARRWTKSWHSIGSAAFRCGAARGSGSPSAIRAVVPELPEEFGARFWGALAKQAESRSAVDPSPRLSALLIPKQCQYGKGVGGHDPTQER
jgi:hypothetical protein